MSIKKSKRGISSPAGERLVIKSKKTSTSTRAATSVQEKGSGVGYAAPAGTLSEETRAKLDELQDQLGDLQESLLLTDVHNDMGDIETTLSLLPAEIEELHTRGYVFRSFLENKVKVLTEQWEEMDDRVSREVSRRQRELERETDVAESALRQAAPPR